MLKNAHRFHLGATIAFPPAQTHTQFRSALSNPRNDPVHLGRHAHPRFILPRETRGFARQTSAGMDRGWLASSGRFRRNRRDRTGTRQRHGRMHCMKAETNEWHTSHSSREAPDSESLGDDSVSFPLSHRKHHGSLLGIGRTNWRGLYTIASLFSRVHVRHARLVCRKYVCNISVTIQREHEPGGGASE